MLQHNSNFIFNKQIQLEGMFININLSIEPSINQLPETIPEVIPLSPKVEVVEQAPVVKKILGRPPGSLGKKKKSAIMKLLEPTHTHKKIRGRPQGSKNKTFYTLELVN